ncbi:TetR/AcrR family transcriptional regulator [Caulobacter sp. NIBR1757]|uniref:TetR/AcrR family transcriptional regulator n=1 Tax=Caulobacter sp. NIBR1757 TaxID=3016000 RepID=UPI0022F12D74|nr:TetR/AcrR family transcriptional regulator [Caulobacter sp. NIBR1757]WGM40967.1 HTH-type transcriptional repressor BepR [Caulobacter sp. NIBR1757]
MQPGPPKFQRRKDDRPGEIVAAALAVFSEKGFAAARLDEIARRAGVSKGALYLYYETKEDIFHAVVKTAVAPDVEMVKARLEAFPGPAAGLLEVFLPTIASILSVSPVASIGKMVISEGRNFPELARYWHDELVAPMIGIVSGMIKRAQERGEVRAGDAKLFAIEIVSPFLMALLWRETFVPIGAQPFDLNALAAQHLSVLKGGMLTPGGVP